jgi:hypothetical protein
MTTLILGATKTKGCPTSLIFFQLFLDLIIFVLSVDKKFDLGESTIKRWYFDRINVMKSPKKVTK